MGLSQLVKIQGGTPYMYQIIADTVSVLCMLVDGVIVKT